MSNSIGDIYTNVFLDAVKDNLSVVRAMCEHPTTKEKYEVIGIDRGNKEIVPLFLVPQGGADTIINYYSLTKDDPAEVNPFILTRANDSTAH